MRYFARLTKLGFAMLACMLAGTSYAVEKLPVVSHWLANSSGRLIDHVPNFISDMVVNYNSDLQFPRPMILSASAWDEGGYGYAAFHNGKVIGKAEWWRDVIYSDTATYGKTKCWIVNFWARASYYKQV